MKNYFKRLFSKEDKKGFMFTTRHLATQTGNGEFISREPHPRSELNFITVGDFTESGNQTVGSAPLQWSYDTTGGTSQKEVKKIDERKEVQPIEVFNEIKKEGLEPDFSKLDEKITAVENRIKILKEHLKDEHLTDEHKALFFLKNRRTYLKTMKKNPLDWAMTNREAIDDLCKRYKLQTVPLKQYYTLVPNDGVKEMSRYSKAYEAITGDKPIFELIIKVEESKPEEKKERTKKDRDPILVANSPLGDFMFVLGAWDDEVEFVDEIIYQGK